MRDLGLIPGGTFSSAADVNDLGVVTGTADGQGTAISPVPIYPNQQCSTLIQPFTWTRTKGIRGIGTVGKLIWPINPLEDPPDNSYWCGQDSYGTGINNRGQGIGYTGNALLAYDLYQYGLTWDSNGDITYFGGSWPPTFANEISNTGEIVGQNSEAYASQLGGNATSWKDGIVTNLSTLPGTANLYWIGSAANGVNDLGQIVGWSWTGTFLSGGGIWVTVPEIHAVLWAENGTITDLGTLSGDTFSEATRISFFGLVIGSSAQQFPDRTIDSLGPQPFHINGHPFIWTQRAGMRDLNTLIPASSGWTLNTATDINVWGQIVGSGTRNGQPHGYLLTPLNPFQVF